MNDTFTFVGGFILLTLIIALIITLINRTVDRVAPPSLYEQQQRRRWLERERMNAEPRTWDPEEVRRSNGH